MNQLLSLVVINLEQVGFGMILFLCAYVSNMGLGAYKSVKIDGSIFDWGLIANSVIKFIILGVCTAVLSITVAVIPQFMTFVGISIDAETLAAIDGVVIIGAFMTATLRYIADSISKIKDILGLSTSS